MLISSLSAIFKLINNQIVKTYGAIGGSVDVKNVVTN